MHVCDLLIGSSTGQQIRHECAGLRHPSLVTRLGLEGREHRIILVVVRRELALVVAVVIAAVAGGAVAVAVVVMGEVSIRGLGVEWRSRDSRGGNTVCRSSPAKSLCEVDVVKAGTLGDVGAGSGRHALKGVIVARCVTLRFGQGGANLVVGKVWLPRVREQRKDSSHALGRASLACRDHYGSRPESQPAGSSREAMKDITY